MSKRPERLVNTSEIEFLSILSLNIAHGRNNSLHQIFQPARQIYKNLDLIANAIIRESPDIVGLQEIDDKSFWSGNFDHLGYLAAKSGYPYFFSGNHAKKLNLTYGTALLSRYPLCNLDSIILFNYRFLPVKGFVVATIQINNCEFDIISLHLDCVSSIIRSRQVKQIIEYQKARKRSCIIMGDFNTEYSVKNSALALLSKTLNLTAFDPKDSLGGTFRFTRKRLDWILFPEQMQIEEYSHLKDVLSDHSAIRARIKFTS